MSGRYRIVWTETAVRDFEDILDFILANNEPLNAEKVRGKLERAVEKLVHLPTRGRVVPELKAEGLDMYQEAIVDRLWRVIYRIRGRRVIVLAVIDGRRDLTELLVQRSLRDLG